ncbi:MAG: 50S ribosomal protein L4 [Planctomycetota bacterium]|jgi:large subunit ribosomal protein L4
MLDIPVYNTDGEKVDTMKVDERLLGSTVNAPLLKQAIVGYHANRRQGTVATKGRGMVAGSTRKMFKQKGTGRARRGPRRTPVVRGGGHTFAKVPRSFRQNMPKKMRRAALKSAVLAKILGEDLLIVDALGFDAPKTSQMASVVKNLKINRSCLLTLADRDANVYLSSRNIPDLTIRIAAELNAFDVATRQKMLITADAMKALLGEEAKA